MHVKHIAATLVHPLTMTSCNPFAGVVALGKQAHNREAQRVKDLATLVPLARMMFET